MPRISVVHVADSDNDGGAARGVRMLHRSLREIGVDSTLVVGRSTTHDPGVVESRRPAERKLGERLESKALRVLHGAPSSVFNPNLLPGGVSSIVATLAPDVVHLHYLGRALLPPYQVARLGRPIVWTLRSMSPFTGGCEYDDGCGRYQDSCGRCPVLGSNAERDISRGVLQLKRKAWSNTDFELVALSDWMAAQARASRLWRGAPVEVIAPGIDVNVFSPRDRGEARRRLGVSEDALVVGFVSYAALRNRRKGWQLLAPTLRRFADANANGRPVALIRAGPYSTLSELDRAGVVAHDLGCVDDVHALALAYAACDVVAVPSLQEAFGKAAAEALACGRPVLGFRSTGVAEIVAHERTGYVADPGDPESLFAGLSWLLADEDRLARLGEAARESAVTRFAARREAEDYAQLYDAVLNRPRR